MDGDRYFWALTHKTPFDKNNLPFPKFETYR